LGQDEVTGTGRIFDKTRVKSSQEIASYLKSNKSLRHLDLSGNMLDITDFEILEKGLYENQTLLGLHLEENPGGSLDPRGFVSTGLFASLTRTTL
jgi:hypothetical protein